MSETVPQLCLLKNKAISILAFIFALMPSIELGPFGILGVFPCFFEGFCPGHYW